MVGRLVAEEAVEVLKPLVGDVSSAFRWEPEGPAPAGLLRGIAGGAVVESEAGVPGWVVRDIGGTLREIPIIAQVGLDWMLRLEAGDKGDLKGPPVIPKGKRAALRERYMLKHFDPIEGGGRLDEKGIYRALNYNDEVVEIVWIPSYYQPATHSTLTLRKGRRISAGIPPTWNIERNIPVSHELVFESLPPDYCFTRCG